MRRILYLLLIVAAVIIFKETVINWFFEKDSEVTLLKQETIEETYSEKEVDEIFPRSINTETIEERIANEDTLKSEKEADALITKADALIEEKRHYLKPDAENEKSLQELDEVAQKLISAEKE